MQMYLDEILAMPGCERLREWCAIGPVQRAAFDEAAALLVAQAMTREREKMHSLLERYQTEAHSYREAYHQLLEQMAAAKATSQKPPAIVVMNVDGGGSDDMTSDPLVFSGLPRIIAPSPLTR